MAPVQSDDVPKRDSIVGVHICGSYYQLNVWPPTIVPVAIHVKKRLVRPPCVREWASGAEKYFSHIERIESCEDVPAEPHVFVECRFSLDVHDTVKVVLQVETHARKVHLWSYVQVVQAFRVSDSGEQQELGRRDCTGAQDDFHFGSIIPGLTVNDCFYSYSSNGLVFGSLEDDLLHLGIRHYPEPAFVMGKGLICSGSPAVVQVHPGEKGRAGVLPGSTWISEF